MNLTEICNEAGIHKSKGYNILSTLQQFGLIHRDEDKKVYSLGPALLTLARRVLDNLDYREIVTPVLESLAEETGIAAFFGLIVEDHVFVIAKKEGRAEVGVTVGVGHRFPLTAGAHGKAIAAFLAEEELREILKGKQLYFHGDPVRFDRKRLGFELAECRAKGYAKDAGELGQGLNAVASPVLGPGGRPVGVLFITGTFPEEKMDELGDAVALCGNQASRLLGGGRVRGQDERGIGE